MTNPQTLGDFCSLSELSDNMFYPSECGISPLRPGCRDILARVLEDAGAGRGEVERCSNVETPLTYQSEVSYSL